MLFEFDHLNFVTVVLVGRNAIDVVEFVDAVCLFFGCRKLKRVRQLIAHGARLPDQRDSDKYDKVADMPKRMEYPRCTYTQPGVIGGGRRG